MTSGEDPVWKALADPRRREILDVLASRPRTTGQLVEHFARPGRRELSRTGVMKHLDVLRAAGLLVARHEGRRRWNFLNPIPIQRFCDRWVSKHVRGLATSLNRLKALAEGQAVPARRVGPIVDDAPAGDLAAGELLGDGLRLRAVDPARDASELYACSHGSAAKEAIWTYMAYGPFRDEAALRAWLEGCARSRDPRFLVVEARATGRPVGMAAYLGIAREQRRVEIGHIWYGPETHGTTTNTEATYLLLKAAFERGYRRVEWKCDALNQRSCEAATRLGFEFEGIFRQHLIVKGRNRDTAWFAMLDDEWSRARPAFEAWLRWQGDDRPSLASLRAG